MFSSDLGAGKGRRSPSRKWGYFLFKKWRGGRVSEEGRQGGAHRGWEGVVGRGGGGRLNIFVSGRNVHQPGHAQNESIKFLSVEGCPKKVRHEKGTQT